MEEDQGLKSVITTEALLRPAVSTNEPCGCTRCGNKETGLLLLLISGHVDDEEEGRALTRGLTSTVTQRFIHAHRLVWL